MIWTKTKEGKESGRGETDEESISVTFHLALQMSSLRCLYNKHFTRHISANLACSQIKDPASTISHKALEKPQAAAEANYP